ncbi:MAG: DNA primase [Nitrospinota bacterium]
MNFNNDVKDRVRGASDIVDIISGYLQLKKSSSTHKGLCPFHSEKTPSMVVNSEKQIFHCFGCGAGGDVFTFVSRIENLSFFESLEKLGSRAGIPVRSNEPLSEEFKLKNRVYEINKKAALFFFNYLQNTVEGKKGGAYLKERGIGDELIDEFQIGYAGSARLGLGAYLKQEGYSFEFQQEAGLLRKNDRGGYSDRFRNRVIFPILNVTGEVAGFGGRIIEASENRPKYLNSPESPVYKKSAILFGLSLAKDSIKKNESVIMVEGYMDVIPLHRAGFKNAVATCGTALTEQHVKLLKRFTGEAIMVFDSDQAGANATVRGYECLEKGGIKVKVVCLPKGKDPDDFLKEEGVSGFSGLLESAKNFPEYIIQRSLSENNNGTVEGKVESVKMVLPYLRVVTNSVEQGYYVSKLAGALKISEKSIYEELDKTKKKTHIYDQESKGGVFETRFKAEQELLKVLLADFSKVKGVRKRVSQEEFKSRTVAEIVDVLYKEQDPEKIETGDLINSLKTPEARRVVSEYVVSETSLDCTDEFIEDCIRDIKRIGENLPGYWKTKTSRLDRQKRLKEQLKEINKIDTGKFFH